MDKPRETVRKRPRRTFTPEFEAEAVRLCKVGDRTDLPPETVPSRILVPGAFGLPPDLMPLELRGVRAINGLHSSDRVQRIPWGSAFPERCVDALHCNRSATKSRFPRRLRAIRRHARSGTPRAAVR